jgi:hypothetical protein
MVGAEYVNSILSPEFFFQVSREEEIVVIGNGPNLKRYDDLIYLAAELGFRIRQDQTPLVCPMMFDGRSGQKPQTEANKHFYSSLVDLLKMQSEEIFKGVLNEYDRRRISKAMNSFILKHEKAG